ncbi:hypothetical protein LCGC14_2864210, partial [marine sediment metagenome]
IEEIEKILYLMDSRIEVLERSNPLGVTEKYLRKDLENLKHDDKPVKSV